MVGAVCLVFGLAYLDLDREQRRALEDFTAEQAALSRALAGTLQARIGTVLADLDTATRLGGPAQLDTFLRGILARDRRFREADVVSADGRVILELPASPDRRLSDARALREARDTAARQATRDRPFISGPLRRPDAATDRERLRLFAQSAGDSVVVLLVDTDRFFDGLAGDPTPAPMRWIVVDEDRRWIDFAPNGAPAARWQLDDALVPAGVLRLLDGMGSGKDGALMLDRGSAAALGLDRRTAVAGFAPVHIAADRTWSLAVVASAMRVRDRARVSAWRLAAATGVAGLLVGLFGFVISRQQQRSLGLAEALRLAEATAALRERSEKIVDAIPIGVLTLDAQGRVVAANPYLTSRGVVPTGSLAQALPNATPDELARLEEILAEARHRRRPITRAGLHMPLGAADPRDVDAHVIPLQHPLPDVDCFLVLHDRTEMRVLERNLARAEKLATIGTLAAGVAHEVGTPLGIISGRAEQLLAKVPADGNTAEASRKALSSILSQVDKVSTTIRQLLDFARVRPVEAVDVSPTQILQTAAALLEHRFKQAKVELIVDAPPTVPAVRGNAGQLEQVFVNLLMNAADACSSGGRVRALASRRGDLVVFEVVDDGCGIRPEDLPRVLDPFFTTKKRGQGTGLGLSIAADIVKNHGGQLEILEGAPAGTRVCVQLPVAKEQP